MEFNAKYSCANLLPMRPQFLAYPVITHTHYM